ncbi:hypothetical protein [Stutzerimonas nitrititolerans]|uniref:hypothetical protein n=1 Tax=Stutzerimonas nitrititolerans TaxID=2482751 RepID=UPI0028A9A0FA|nr:hypothetical protein [Stutzerimonas nitrititolerans]
MANEINGEEVHGMVGHWLATPVNGYLGSGYGSDPQSLIQKPMSAGLGDAFIQKMERDVPVIGILPGGAVNVYFEDRDNRSKNLIVNVMDRLVRVDSTGTVS